MRYGRMGVNEMLVEKKWIKKYNLLLEQSFTLAAALKLEGRSEYSKSILSTWDDFLKGVANQTNLDIKT